ATGPMLRTLLRERWYGPFELRRHVLVGASTKNRPLSHRLVCQSTLHSQMSRYGSPGRERAPPAERSRIRTDGVKYRHAVRRTEAADRNRRLVPSPSWLAR